VIVIPRTAGSGSTGTWRFSAQQVEEWTRRLRADSTRFSEIPLGKAGHAFLAAPPEPGPGPESWLAAPAGPPRPPAALRFPAPVPVAVAVDGPHLQPGDTLVVGTRWIRSGPPDRLDPRGYRVRVELCPLPTGPPSWFGRWRKRWGTMIHFFSGRQRTVAIETPLLGGLPVPRWPAQAEQAVRLALPRSLVPGTYEVRVAALPGPVSRDHGGSVICFLPPREIPIPVQVLPAR